MILPAVSLRSRTATVHKLKRVRGRAGRLLLAALPERFRGNFMRIAFIAATVPRSFAWPDARRPTRYQAHERNGSDHSRRNYGIRPKVPTGVKRRRAGGRSNLCQAKMTDRRRPGTTRIEALKVQAAQRGATALAQVTFGRTRPRRGLYSPAPMRGDRLHPWLTRGAGSVLIEVLTNS